MKYRVTVEEILRRTIDIEAENRLDAESKVRKMYSACEIVLTADDFIGEPMIVCME